jgi:alkanesulfonate monooxygenase SsuD/methylene tetrahydromethanopterin reductase-like flavin-dependent oxidoreductase (luciferase family)
LLLDQFASAEVIGERIALFKSECEARGRGFDPMDVAVARNVYVADDPEDAELARARQAAVHARMVERSRAAGSHILAHADEAGAAEASVLFGPAEEIVAGLKALREAGARYFLVSGPEARQTMRRFAAQVMPALLGDDRWR